jgi:hypothetical protein
LFGALVAALLESLGIKFRHGDLADVDYSPVAFVVVLVGVDSVVAHYVYAAAALESVGLMVQV